MKEHDTEEHMDNLISGYIDGELTQQQRQFVAVKMENDAAFKDKVEQFSALKAAVGKIKTPELESEKIDALLNDPTSMRYQTLGFAALIIGVSIPVVFSFVTFYLAPDVRLTEKVIISLIGGGLIGIFISVARQQYIARKTDKYKGVKL